MKKNTLLTLAILFVFLCRTPFFAFASEEKIRVGYTDQDDIIIDINNTGHEGYGYEILKKIEEISDLEFEFVKIEDDIFEALEKGEVDVIGFYFKTPEREKKYLYLKTHLNTVQIALMAPTTKNRVYDNPEIIDGKTVATYRGNGGNNSLREYLKENNISVNYVYGDLGNYKELEADYYLVYSSDSELKYFNNLINFPRRFSYLISLPDKKEIMDKIDVAVNEILTTEGNFFDTLTEEYMSDAYHTFHRSLTENELQILRQKTLKVAYHDIARPLAFTNSEGKADGALVDVMNRLAELYEFKVEYYPYTEWNAPLVLADCDITLAAAGDANYFAKHFTTSEYFFNLPTIAIANPDKLTGEKLFDIANLSSNKVGALDFLYNDFKSLLQITKNNPFTSYTNFNTLLDAYKNNEIDIMVITQFSLGYVNSYLGKTPYFAIASNFDIEMHLSIANDIADVYVPIFNIMLDNISEQEYQDILVQNQAIHFYEQSFIDDLADHWYYVALFGFAIISLFLFSSFTEQKQQKQAIQDAHDTDAITSLMTFHKFIEETKKTVTTSENNSHEVISFDIDMYKNINAYFGEEKGLQIQINIANALREAFKGYPVFLCRKFDENFLIVRRIDEGGKIEDICDKFIIPSILKVVGEQYNLSLSFGIATIDDRDVMPSTYIGRVENARKRGKTESTTTFNRFDESMKKDYENRLNVTNRMKNALKNHEFSVFYQPKIDFQTLRVGGAEALVRWLPKDEKAIFPDEFIPVFEKNGFILSLDMYVLEDVCRFIVENEGKIEIPKISVNLSARSVLANDLIERILEIVVINGINPKKIEFELTESAIESNTELFLKRVDEIKECGFTVSIDDFGAGVSSLNRLSAVEANVLKLDKAFFDLKGKEAKNKVVVSNVIAMAKELDMMVVAEGVETKEQALWLREIKSDYAQGYYFARPMDEKAFKELLVQGTTFSLD